MRISILEALEAKPMGFAEIKKCVGIESSGHLQFHLRKLGSLVEDASNGAYTLTDDGRDALPVFRTSATKESKDSRMRPLDRLKRNPKIVAIAIFLAFLVLFGAFASFGGKIYTSQSDLTTYSTGPYTQGSWYTIQFNKTSEWVRFNIELGAVPAGNQSQQVIPVQIQLVHEQSLSLESLSMQFARASMGCYWVFDRVDYAGIEGYPPPSAKLYTPLPGDTSLDLQNFGFVGTGSVNIFLNIILERVVSQFSCQNGNGGINFVLTMQLQDSSHILTTSNYYGYAYAFMTPNPNGLITIDRVSG